MSNPPTEFYSEERWQNWIDRIKDEDIDPEDESSARLLLNLQDDTAIAIAKIVAAYDDGELDQEETLEEINDVREIVLSEIDIEDEEKLILVDGVQTSLVCVFFAAEEYVANGRPTRGLSVTTSAPRPMPRPKRTSTLRSGTRHRPGPSSSTSRNSI